MASTYSVEDIIKLMSGMAEHRVGVLEMPGLKLVASPPERMSQTAAASNMSAPRDVTPDQAMRATQAARLEAVRLAELQRQTQTARTRAAAGGIGTQTGKLVDDVFKEAVRPQRAKKTDAR